MEGRRPMTAERPMEERKAVSLMERMMQYRRASSGSGFRSQEGESTEKRIHNSMYHTTADEARMHRLDQLLSSCFMIQRWRFHHFCQRVIRRSIIATIVLYESANGWLMQGWVHWLRMLSQKGVKIQVDQGQENRTTVAQNWSTSSAAWKRCSRNTYKRI